VHLHARNPQDGRPDQTPEAFAPFLREIKKRSNVVVNLTTGGSPFMKVEERLAPAAVFKPEIASLNMGSMNFGLFPMLKRFKSFRFDWEPEMLENSRDLVFRNSFKDITYALNTLNATGTRYEFECYDTSHLYNLHYFYQEGLKADPTFGLLDIEIAIQRRGPKAFQFEIYCIGDGYQSGHGSSKPQPLAIEFRIGARTVATADWPYPTVLNGHMDALTFSAPIAITDSDFEQIDSALLPSVRAEATICLE